jgi:hypothetical protein
MSVKYLQQNGQSFLVQPAPLAQEAIADVSNCNPIANHEAELHHK